MEGGSSREIRVAEGRRITSQQLVMGDVCIDVKKLENAGKGEDDS